jgi:hypothetical protein
MGMWPAGRWMPDIKRRAPHQRRLLFQLQTRNVATSPPGAVVWDLKAASARIYNFFGWVWPLALRSATTPGILLCW